jgi:F0F1-type ATP synthase assembly protein I
VRVHKLEHSVVSGARFFEVVHPVKLVPDQQRIADAQHSGQTLGRGMDFALVVLVFLGIGYGLDRWLDTRPGFMIGLTVFAVVGQFVKMYYDYTNTMEQLEAQRAEGRKSSVRRDEETSAA